jgi:hypothetical protein
MRQRARRLRVTGNHSGETILSDVSTSLVSDVVKGGQNSSTLFKSWREFQGGIGKKNQERSDRRTIERDL